MRDDVARHPIDARARIFPLARRETRENTYLTNDARPVVVVEDVIVIEDVVEDIIARRRMHSID